MFLATILTDEDGHHITKLVTDTLTECVFVDLSVNRFQCKDTKWLLEILKLDRVTTVDITANSISSEDVRNLVKDAEDLLHKLIFIPDYWLRGELWRETIGNKNKEEEIKSVHVNYYNKIHSYLLFQRVIIISSFRVASSENSNRSARTFRHD